MYDPVYHYSPSFGWMNDPNGLYYLDGVYHLFYQYNPTDSQFGNMSWGHATSVDLVNWTEQDVALAYSDQEWIFSGSAVVDHDNTSGFGYGENGEPQDCDMVAVSSVYERLINNQIEAADARHLLGQIYGHAPLSNGFVHAQPGVNFVQQKLRGRYATTSAG